MDDTKLPPHADRQGQTQQGSPDEPHPQQTEPGQTAWNPPPPPHPDGAVLPPPYSPYGGGQPPQPPQPAQPPQPYAYPAYPAYPPHEASAPAAPPVRSRPATRTVLVAAAVLILGSVALALTGQVRTFLLIGVEIAPLAILAALAYAGVRNTTAQVFAYIWLAIVALGALLNSFLSVLGAVMDLSALQNLSAGSTALLRPGAGPALAWTMLLLLLSVLVALAMLFRPVRALVARIMPIDPDNFVHKIALCILTLITFTSFVPLIALQGRPPLLEVVKQSQALGNSQDLGLGAGPLDLVYQFVWTIPATLVAAGWPIARRFREALVRLGMVRPSLMQVAAGVGLGLVLAVVASLVIDRGIQEIWRSLGWATTDQAAFEKLLGRLITPLGALVIGVTAGVGEEMAVRGLLQPRIGLIASNLVFTSLHAFQYGVDALLSVFIVGLILGIIRARSNTTTSAIVHGVYDFTLVLATYLTGP